RISLNGELTSAASELFNFSMIIDLNLIPRSLWIKGGAGHDVAIQDARFLLRQNMLTIVTIAPLTKALFLSQGKTCRANFTNYKAFTWVPAG
ncbi:MAG: hypothetical protein PHG20_10255, partial [Geobacteraceae bacterium]|nr:hypothetical protein [Geobacteraceae bacterium]